MILTLGLISLSESGNVKQFNFYKMKAKATTKMTKMGKGGSKATAKPKMKAGGTKKYAMAGTTSDGIFSKIFGNKKKKSKINYQNPINPSMCRGSNCGKPRKKTPGL